MTMIHPTTDCKRSRPSSSSWHTTTMIDGSLRSDGCVGETTIGPVLLFRHHRLSRQRQRIVGVTLFLGSWISCWMNPVLALSTTTTAPKPPTIQKNVIQRVSAGSTGLTISQLGCGTWSWGNRLLFDYNPQLDEEIYQAYCIVRNAGVTLFDTADSYGTFDLNGRAEVLLGQFEQRYQQEKQEQAAATWTVWPFNAQKEQEQDRYRQQVATKLAPYPWRITRQSIVRAAQESVKRLSPGAKMDIAQLHWSTANYQPYQERALWDGIADVYNAGLCNAVGVSNYGPKQLQKVAQYFRNERDPNNTPPLAIAQIQYSLMTYKTIGQEMNDACNAVNCRLVSYSPLCLGLLTGKYTLDNLPSTRLWNPRRQLFRELLPSAQPIIATLQVMGKEYGNKTPSQIAINWAICKDTVPIPGCRTPQQAVSNVQAASFRLPPDAIAELDRVALSITKPMIQNIFQTK